MYRFIYFFPWLCSWSFEQLSFWKTKLLTPFERITLYIWEPLWFTTVQIASKQKTCSNGFLYSILDSVCRQMLLMTKAVCMPCRIVNTRHYESFQLWELWNLFKESFPKATSNALDKAYLATMKCVVVSKAFKKVAEEQTKFKQLYVN